eukprot:366129-Chlamydomonas_euryale.AAC.2
MASTPDGAPASTPAPRVTTPSELSSGGVADAQPLRISFPASPDPAIRTAQTEVCVEGEEGEAVVQKCGAKRCCDLELCVASLTCQPTSAFV